MYKNADKQKEANKRAAQRRRDKAKGMTNQSMTQPNVIPKSNTLHPDIIARIGAIASGPEDRARRIKGAEDYAQLFTNCPAYSEFAKRMAQAGPQVNRPGTDTVVIEQPSQGCYLSPNKLVCSVETHTASTVDEE